MKVFDNQTTAGHELAIKRGKQVPDGAVNLAFVKSPVMTPEKNVVIVDTSRIVAENVIENGNTTKLYYANALGILVDSDGNVLIEDEFPIISDVFNVEGNISGENLDNEDPLPFVHLSRYFHIDYVGLTLGSNQSPYDTNKIKVVDAKGNTYVDEDGKPRYKIKIAPAHTPKSLNSQSAYRVLAYIDTDQNEQLYLVYNKIEVANDTGILQNQEINFKELLNPQPYFQYVPEESEVVDLPNRENKIYSTKPINLKEQILGLPAPIVNGWKAYVPKKAVGDPRIFQLFRWRLACDFSENYGISTIKDLPINCGIIITNLDLTSAAPGVFSHLYNSATNHNDIVLANPLNAGVADKIYDSYWYVNFDTITNEDLARFDMLVWSPTKDFDMGPYLSKIDYFTNALNRKLFIDTNSSINISNIDMTLSSPVAPTGPSSSRSPGSTAIKHINPYFDASALGGWAIDTDDPVTVLQGALGGGTNVQYILASPGYTPMMDILETHYTSTTRTVTTTQVVTITDSWTKTTPGSLSNDGVQVANNVWAVTVPSLPPGATFDRIEIQNYRFFTADNGSQVVLSLNDVFGNTTSSPVFQVNGSSATAELLYTSTDPSLVGTQFQCDFAIHYGSHFVITSGIMRATLYYHVDTTINNNHLVGLPANVPTTYTIPVVTEYPVIVSRNNLIFSTCGVLLSAAQDMAGAQELLYNILLYAASGRKLYQADNQRYATNFSFATNWQNSWVINNPLTGDQVLTEDEKILYDFAALPKDVNDTQPMWQRRLSPKTCKELVDVLMSPEILQATSGLTRAYRLEVTNSNVHTTSTLADAVVPYAWTTAYTPRFVVPSDLGTYVVRDENIAAELTGGSYSYKIYPPKPYKGFARASYLTASTMMTPQTATWTATGIATETYDVSLTDPDQQIIQQIVVSSPVTETSQVELTWENNSNRSYVPQNNLVYTGSMQPDGIALWSENNYYNANFGAFRLNWPYFGLTGRYEQGNSGDVPKFIQDVLNTLNYFTKVVNPGVGRYLLPGGALAIDGVYGAKTTAAVKEFQRSFNLLSQDGIVDAETWAAFGGQIIRWNITSNGATDHKRFYDYPFFHMQKHLISDGDNTTHFAKRSNTKGSPGNIWELFLVQFNQQYAIHAVGVVPFVEGDANTVIIDTVDVRSQFPASNLNGFDGNSSLIRGLYRRVPDNVLEVIPLSYPIIADTIIVGIGQDSPAGKIWGDARMFGVREIKAYAEVQTTRTVDTVVDQVVTVPGVSTVTKQSRDIQISATGTVGNLLTDVDQIVRATPDYVGSGQLSNITWTTVQTNNANVVSNITSDGAITLKNILSVTQNGAGLINGPVVPSGVTTYSMTIDGRLNLSPEQGWVSKAEGVKLLCNSAKQPIGIPAMPPTTGPADAQRHYVSLTFVPQDVEASVKLGFYDIARQEFILSDAGVSELAYKEYIDRGPQNIYIGVVSTFELDAQHEFPSQNDSPSFVPNLWAMPVYGVTTRYGGRITLESLPPNLGAQDLWPVAVRNGNFSKTYDIASSSPLTSYLQRYAGDKVSAYYSIPEAKQAGWSSIYGAPNADVKAEQPIILDDNVIQVRQAPILMKKIPTAFPSDADPVRPIFTVYQRPTPVSSWTPLPLTEIADYNVSTGEIFLKTPLLSNDASLLKVDYVTVRRHFYFKYYNNTILNLNPYPGQSRDLLGKAIYIYIVPAYIKDSLGRLITESVQTTTLRFTTDPTIFNAANPNYDPMAVELGVLYMSTALDINELVILDTRRRGGGGKDTVSDKELVQDNKEASMYWDVNSSSGMLYQKGGFIIIRLPSSVKNDFSEAQIRQIIDRNLTAGVKYKLEDLNGRDWAAV